MSDFVMTIPETAAWLRMDLKVAYRLAKRGQLPGAVKIGGAWRVAKAAMMEKFLNSGGEVEVKGAAEKVTGQRQAAQ